MPHLLRTGSVFRLSHSTGLCFHTQNFNYRSFLVCFEVDFTCLEVHPLEMDSSAVFGLFTELCVHFHCLIPEHIHQWSVPRLLCPQPLATTSLLSVLMDLPLPDICGKWNHTRVVSVSGPFGQRDVSQPVPSTSFSGMSQVWGDWSFLGGCLLLSWIVFVLWLSRGNSPSACQTLEGCLLVFLSGWRMDVFVRLGRPI